MRIPTEMDGVPGLSFRGIAPGETFVYRFPGMSGMEGMKGMDTSGMQMGGKNTLDAGSDGEMRQSM